MMMRVFAILLLISGVGVAQDGDTCCKCEAHSPSEHSGGAICLTDREMRSHVDHIEPLQPSGLGTGLNLSGTVVMEIRLDPNGKVACARAKSGHPIAISAAMQAIPKWTFKPVLSNGVRKAGCGRITIKYSLRDRGSSTELR